MGVRHPILINDSVTRTPSRLPHPPATAARPEDRRYAALLHESHWQALRRKAHIMMAARTCQCAGSSPLATTRDEVPSADSEVHWHWQLEVDTAPSPSHTQATAPGSPLWKPELEGPFLERLCRSAAARSAARSTGTWAARWRLRVCGVRGSVNAWRSCASASGRGDHNCWCEGVASGYRQKDLSS
jgi:hypothetical protein